MLNPATMASPRDPTANLLASIDSLLQTTTSTLDSLRELSDRYSDGARIVQNFVVEHNSIHSQVTQLKQWAEPSTAFAQEVDLASALQQSFDTMSLRTSSFEDEIQALVERAAVGSGGLFKKKPKLARVWDQTSLDRHMLEAKWQAQAMQIVLTSLILPPLERRRRLNMFVKRASAHYAREDDAEGLGEELTVFGEERPLSSGGTSGIASFAAGPTEDNSTLKRLRGWSVSRSPFESEFSPPLLQQTLQKSTPAIGRPSSTGRQGSIASTTASSGSFHASSGSYSAPSPKPSTAPIVLPQLERTYTGSSLSNREYDLEEVQQAVTKAQKAYADGHISEGAKGFETALSMSNTSQEAEDVGLDAFTIAEQWGALRLQNGEWEGIEAVLRTLFDRVGHDNSARLIEFHQKYNRAMLKKACELFRAEKYSVARKICKIVSGILDRLVEAGFDIVAMKVEVNFAWASILLHDSGSDKAIGLLAPILDIVPTCPEEVFNIAKAHDMIARAYFLKRDYKTALTHAETAFNSALESSQRATRLKQESAHLLSDIHTALGDKTTAKKYKESLPEGYLTFLWNPHDIYTFRLQQFLVRPTLSTALSMKDRTTLRFLLSWDTPQENSRDESWIHTLARKDEAQALSLLLSRQDTNVNARMRTTGSTALHLACAYTSSLALPHLLSHPKIDPNALDTKGRTPLHALFSRSPSASAAQTTILHKLLAMPNIRINLQDEEGMTPLHEAFKRGNVEAIRVLLARREVELGLRDRVGRLAVEEAGSERIRAEYEGYFR